VCEFVVPGISQANAIIHDVKHHCPKAEEIDSQNAIDADAETPKHRSAVAACVSMEGHTGFICVDDKTDSLQFRKLFLSQTLQPILSLPITMPLSVTKVSQAPNPN
jgi:hypothetical protein